MLLMPVSFVNIYNSWQKHDPSALDFRPSKYTMQKSIHLNLELTQFQKQ